MTREGRTLTDTDPFLPGGRKKVAGGAEASDDMPSGARLRFRLNFHRFVFATDLNSV